MKSTRRKFLQNGTLAGLGVLSASQGLAAPFYIAKDWKISPNDKIRLATVGMGIQGHYDTNSALKVPGVELVAVADLYTDRHIRTKEVFGKDIFTTRDYRELLTRSDIDAVLIATPDHWHDTITIDSLKAGKNVYCEKPMVQQISEGRAVIDAWKASGKTMQVGSQSISGSVFQEAKRLLQAGEIGQINFIESNSDRFNSIGAWNYTIPDDATAENTNWDVYLKDTPKLSFDPKRYFRWRNYKYYGTGVAGDLFVHLITGVHYATGSHGPNRIFASGNLSFWKDGRDVPDVMVAILDYPKTAQFEPFQMVLRVNFANAGAIVNNTRIIGSEGQLDIRGNSLILSKNKLQKAPGFGGYDSVFTFPEEKQKTMEAAYKAKYSEEDRKYIPVKETTFKAPDGENSSILHFANFFDNIRKGSQSTIEDPVFGFRAAAPVLACNESYFQQKPILWDPETMKLKKK